jgi:transposase-like protein
MTETRRKFDRDFKEDAARLVRETGRPIAVVVLTCSWPCGNC